MNSALSSLQKGSWIAFFRDREYYRRLVNIGVPIALQQLFTSSLNMVGQVMIGQLGDTAVASVALANQIFFLLNLFLFGANSGMAIFTAQFWGKGDEKNIRRVLGMAIVFSMLLTAGFFIASFFFPQRIIGLYSHDPEVIRVGSEYLRLFGWSFPFFAIGFCYSLILRTVGQVRLPLVVSVFALSLNALLSYSLIFGVFGLPPMGVKGAALAIVISRILECLVLLWLTYRLRTPLAVKFSELWDFDFAFVRRVLTPVLPVAANEILWSLGITTYSGIYARIGTQSLAAVNIALTIDQIALVLFSGMAHGTAVLVGNWIGAGNERQAFRYAGRSLVLGAFFAIGMGILLLLFSPFILSLYKVSPEVIESAQKVLRIIALFLWVRASNMIMIVGIFRSGGDTRFSLFLDGIIIWILGVPMAMFAAFVLHLPVHWVYVFVLSEELVKVTLGLRRYFSHRWIHNLTRGV